MATAGEGERPRNGEKDKPSGAWVAACPGFRVGGSVGNQNRDVLGMHDKPEVFHLGVAVWTLGREGPEDAGQKRGPSGGYLYYHEWTIGGRICKKVWMRT